MRIRIAIFTILVLVWGVLFANAQSASASVLFDNGAYNAAEMSTGFIFNVVGQEMIDNFSLASLSTITEIDWSQHDSGSYQGTTLDIFAGAKPASATPLFSTTQFMSRTPNAEAPLFGFSGFDYSLTGLSVSLPAGTYSLGIFSDGTQQQFLSGWDYSVGSAQTIPGSYLGNPAGANFPQQTLAPDQVFDIVGNQQPTPEPSTFVLLAGCVATAWFCQSLRRRCVWVT